MTNGDHTARNIKRKGPGVWVVITSVSKAQLLVMVSFIIILPYKMWEDLFHFICLKSVFDSTNDKLLAADLFSLIIYNSTPIMLLGLIICSLRILTTKPSKMGSYYSHFTD